MHDFPWKVVDDTNLSRQLSFPPANMIFSLCFSFNLVLFDFDIVCHLPCSTAVAAG